MAIQLARAIGMQRKPISPLEGLPEIIQKTGSDILSGMQQAGAAKAAQAEKKQAIKDAAAANVSFDPIEGTPEDQAEYEKYGRDGIAELAALRADPNVTPAQFQAAKDKFEYGLKERKIKYKADFETISEAAKRKSEGTYYTDDFDKYLAGTPDREEINKEKQTEFENKRKELEERKQGELGELSSYEDVPEGRKGAGEKQISERYAKELSDLEGSYTPEKITVKGEKGYLELPFEERKKIDLKSELEEKSVISDSDALKASQGYFGSEYTPRIHVGVTTTSRGATEFVVDKKGLELDAQKYATSFIGNTSYSKEHNIKKRNYENAAIRALEKNGLPVTPENVADFTSKIAYEDFKTASDVAVKDEIRKQREARAQWGNIYYTSGGGESKKDNYVDEESYNTDLVAKSTYENVVADKEFDKYISDEKKKVSLINEYGGGTLKSTDREGLKEAWIKQTKKPSRLYEGKTVEEGWVEKAKRDLSRYEGLPAISFNNKTAKNVELEDDGKYRQFIPDKVIYKKDGSIEGIEVHAAVQGEDGSYVKKPQSLQVIPITERNFEALKGGFPELFTYAKGRGVNLSYTEGKKAEGKGAETKKEGTKPKTYKINGRDWSLDKVEKAAKASGMSVDEYIKEVEK